MKNLSYINRELVRLFSFLVPQDATLLEIGCGDGDRIASIPAAHRTGIDRNSRAVYEARSAHPGISFIEDDVEKLETRGSFEYVLIPGLLGSLHDIEQSLRNVHQVIAPRGRLVITSRNYLWQPLYVLAEKLGLRKKKPPQNWLTPYDIENFLALSGFEVIHSGKRVLCPVRIPGISFLCNQILVRLPLLWRLGAVQYIVARPTLKTREDVSVSIVVPARNEKGNIEHIVRRLPEFPKGTEIIFVEGHSKDGTWKEIERVRDVYQNKKNIVALRQDGMGKGDAVRKGFAEAQNDLLMIFDADMTVLPEDLPKFYRALTEGAGEFIHGSRLVYPLEKEAMRFLNNMANKFFALAFSWLLDQRFKDTLCGTKVLLKSDYEWIARNRNYFGEFDPFGDFDLLFGAAHLNLKIIDVPVRYYARRYGTTQIQRFRHGWLLLKMCIVAARKLKFNP